LVATFLWRDGSQRLGYIVADGVEDIRVNGAILISKYQSSSASASRTVVARLSRLMIQVRAASAA
jgi:hypothetical protein